MILFVNITDSYFLGNRVSKPKLCSFIDTINNKFIETNGSHATHVFNCIEQIQEHNMSDKLMEVLPEGFFKK